MKMIKRFFVSIFEAIAAAKKHKAERIVRGS